MTDEGAIIDALDPDQLRNFAHHQNRLVQRLLREREGHLKSVEQVSPGPYVELFCRRPRLGWDSWGKGYEMGETA